MSKQYPPLVLELVDRKPSSFVMRGTEDSQMPDRLDVSSVYMLLNHSYNLVPGKKKDDPKVQKVTRWIAGSEEILVEKQDELGIVYNPMRDIIAFNFGTLTVEREGDKVGLYDFLKNYDGNVSNLDRPAGTPPIFKEINTSIEAEVRIGNVTEEAEALSIISSHVKAVKNGAIKTYQYNTEKLIWLCKLFNLTTNDSDAERVEALVEKARRDPALFIQTIEDLESDILVVIKTANEIGVIVLNGDQAIFSDQSLITKLKGRNVNDKMRELAEFLMSPDGEMLNSSLRTQVEYAKTKALENK